MFTGGMICVLTHGRLLWATFAAGLMPCQRFGLVAIRWNPLAMGQKPNRTPSEHRNPTRKICSKMGGAPTPPLVLTHGHFGGEQAIAGLSVLDSFFCFCRTYRSSATVGLHKL